MDWDALYAQARIELGLARAMRLRAKPFRVLFFPYAGIRSIIHDRRDHYEVRVSDLLRDAPEEVHRALAKLLTGKIDRRLRSRPDERAAYTAWTRDPDNLAKHDALRRERGRGKRIEPPAGRIHNLDRLFERINREYFEGRLTKPTLGWSRGASRRLYGHHDPVHDAIVINRLLDHPRVPEAVVGDILHHEMLHVKHGVRVGGGGRRIMHPREFKQDERRFAQHEEAKSWLKGLESRRIRLRLYDGTPARPQPGRFAGQLRLEQLFDLFRS